MYPWWTHYYPYSSLPAGWIMSWPLPYIPGCCSAQELPGVGGLIRCLQPAHLRQRRGLRGHCHTGCYGRYCSWHDIQRHVDRGSMQMVLMSYDLFFWKKEKQQSESGCLQSRLYKFNSIEWLLTLFTPILLQHAWFGCASWSFSMLSLSLLGINCFSFPLSGGPGPPSTPPPMLTPFPSDPRQQLFPCRAQVLGYSMELTRLENRPKHVFISYKFFVVIVHYHSGGSIKLNACISHLAYMVYL